MHLMVLQQRLAKPAPPRRLFDRLAFFSTRKALLKMLQLKCAAASFSRAGGNAVGLQLIC